MGNRNALLIVAAVFIGLIAVVLANAYFSGMEERQVDVAQEQGLVRIVVATQPLEFGTPLSTENVRLQNFPANSVPEGAFRTIEDALRDSRVALRPIVPNEPVLASKVSGTGGRAVLSANLAEGMRAVAISTNAVQGVSGFVRPGDVVDIFLTRQISGEGSTAQDLVTEVVLENIKVLAIDQVAAENATEPTVARTAVLEVDQRDAQKLVLAGRIGTLSLALRNVEEQDAFGPGALVTNREFASSRLSIAARPQTRTAAEPVAAQALQTLNNLASAVSGRPAIMGPSMTIYRGVEPTEEPVGNLGGS
ncbi:MAG TPA: Flp pilus assembly protein CpaB [Paracoccaceae bacterium]|nr:Flp pilus assembly protein CpaB [Paracoccaceae bacterium]